MRHIKMDPLTNMFLVVNIQNVLARVELTLCLKQDREKQCVMFHTCANLFLPRPVTSRMFSFWVHYFVLH